LSYTIIYPTRVELQKEYITKVYDETAKQTPEDQSDEDLIVMLSDIIRYLKKSIEKELSNT